MQDAPAEVTSPQWPYTVAGVAAAVCLALVARLTSSVGPPWLSEAPIAVAAGLVIRSTGWLPAEWQIGLRFCSGTLLRVGIVLLGAQLSLAAFAEAGLFSLGLVLGVVLFSGLAYLTIRHALRVPPRTAALIAVGTAICGNTAIATLAPLIRATDEEVSYAVSVITVLGTSALFIFPIAAGALSFSPTAFGVWAGTAIHDTSQVIGAASAYNSQALAIATVVKLTRNALMLPVLLGVGFWFRRAKSSRPLASRALPWFLFGFTAMAAARSAGIIDTDLAGNLQAIARISILIALAAIGMLTSIRTFRSVGMGGFLMALIIAVSVAIASATAISLAGL